MYDLPYHKELNDDVINEFIAQYPFAFLTGCTKNNEIVVTQLPFFLEEKEGKKKLRGHIMRNTDHHNAFKENKKVTVVFTGPSAYVSGTWYSNPNTPSTWNYMSVHIKGNIRFVDSVELENILRTAALYFEQGNTQSATLFDNIPGAFRKKVLQMIVGFEIDIIEMDNIFKLSQDRDHESYQNIIKELRTKDFNSQVIAAEMQQRARDLFQPLSKDNT